MTASYGSLPFDEQIALFREKLNLPTKSWTDLWEGMHARAFVVAGAMKDDLLADLRAAVDKAVAEGMALEAFKRDFRRIVETHGWKHTGGPGWRSRVIYETNIRQSYSAGREKQMQDPALRKKRPYGLYRHGRSEHPRPEHLAWDGLVLPLGDPWWETHTPQNGWGCKCRKRMVGDRDLDRMGLKVAPEAPPMEWREATVGTLGPNPRTVKVPKGIDPGFAYNPGTAAWGRVLSEQAMADWAAAGASAWERLTPGDWRSAGRPGRMPVDAAKAAPGPVAADRSELLAMTESVIGGAERVYALPGGGAVNVNAETLAGHIDVGRSRYLPLLPDLMADPFEQWLAFERHKGTGKVVLRTRLVKVVQAGKDKGLLLVAQAVRGQLEAWTFLPAQTGYIQKQRVGNLVYGRE